MPRPLFEVTDLRVAVFDADRAVEGIPGPTTDAGEELPPGWVEVVPRLSFSVAPGEVLALVGESASGKSLALMGGFSLLSPGARVIGGETRYKDVVFRPGGSLDLSDSKRSRKRRRESQVAGTVVADYDDDAWARTVGTEMVSFSRIRSVPGHRTTLSVPRRAKRSRSIPTSPMRRSRRGSSTPSAR